MCNNHQTVDFSDLEDDFLSHDSIPETELDTPEEREMRHQTAGHITSRATVGRYVCPGCHGRGTIAIYRRGGGWGQTPEQRKCWKGCGGTGYVKTSPEQRAKNKERRERRKQMEKNRTQDAAIQFLNENPRIKAWFNEHGPNPDWRFPAELLEKLFKYGELTPGQLGAIEKCIKRDEAKRAEREASQPDTVDLSKMRSGHYAVPGGDTRLKVRIDVVDKGKWAGWVFVKDGAEYGRGKRYGSQRPGQQYQGDIVEELKIIAADPSAAMAAYGHLVGRCGMCGRKLEDPESIERGIGPVCASRL